MTVIFEDELLLVRSSSSGEIFVTNKVDGRTEMRIGHRGADLTITCHDGTLVPGEINGVSAIYVRGGKPR
ncbi:hypothetical protein KW782_02705 [Candidatus Parcubacteria bacterium]|nr:hypothetical protein [Candidatus Parcubacteria bacterium]